MKKMITASLFTLAASGAFAQAELDQHIAVTRDTIARLSADLQTRDSANGLRLTDYRPWEQEFKRSMEKNLAAFQREVTQRVFGPWKEIKSKMHKVWNDKNMPEHQKRSLLNALDVSLTTMLPSIKKEYHEALARLYGSNNHFASDLKIIKFKRSRDHDMGGYAKKAHSIYFDGKMSPSFDVSFWEGKNLNPPYLTGWVGVPRIGSVPYSITHERIIDGCQSKACLIVKSGDIAFWYTSVREMLDIEITISTPSGHNHTLTRTYYPVGEILRILQRTDFPQELENLPFDV